MEQDNEKDDPDDKTQQNGYSDYYASIERTVRPDIFGAAFVLFSRIASPNWNGSGSMLDQSSRPADNADRRTQRGMKAALSVLKDLDVPAPDHLAYLHRLMSAAEILDHPSLAGFHSQRDWEAINPVLLNAMAVVECPLGPLGGYRIDDLLVEVERTRLDAPGDEK